MASIRKRGGAYEYRVRFQTPDGKWQERSKGGFRTKRLAEAAAVEVQSHQLRGADLSRTDITLLDYWDDWVALYKTGKNSLVTEKRYPIIRKALRAEFGQSKLTDITRSDWQRFLNRYGDTHSHITVEKLNGYVRTMVRSAMNDQLIYTDFTFGAIITGADGKKDADKFLEADQFAAVIDYARERVDFNHLSMLAIYLGAMSGARFSELVGLTWDDIDFDACTISINKTWDYHFGQGFLPTKTPSGVRTVKLTPPTMDVLKAYKAQQAAYSLRIGFRDDKKLVFRARTHQVLTNAGANKALKTAQEAIDADPELPSISKSITFHGLRHSHVSYLLSQHVDIYYISKRLGHKDITITQQVYSHMLDTLQTEQENATVSALEKLVGNSWASNA
ncbi:site-specific integrase [Lacticaseibacillus absianus]|uniref:site-specific integrase n=1 Tax=Lacticaseibacillus absianus TaxID=2729623 RepID=UPI0015CB9180|nr:site-specific integrase [Lacticaseibacillus absianus]